MANEITFSVTLPASKFEPQIEMVPPLGHFSGRLWFVWISQPYTLATTGADGMSRNTVWLPEGTPLL